MEKLITLWLCAPALEVNEKSDAGNSSEVESGNDDNRPLRKKSRDSRTGSRTTECRKICPERYPESDLQISVQSGHDIQPMLDGKRTISDEPENEFVDLEVPMPPHGSGGSRFALTDPAL